MKSPYTDDNGNEVTPLRIIADTGKTRSAEVVRMLEKLLEQARAGEVTDACYIVVRKGEYEVGRTTSIMDAVGQSAFLHYRFLKQMER